MDLAPYFTPIRKWWKLILIAALIAGVSTAITLFSRPSIYESTTTLMIGQSITSPNPSSTQFYLEQDLAQIYADMGNREPIRRAAMEALGMNSLPPYSIQALPNTQLLEITVRDTNPVRSQAVAAELANQLIRQTPTEDNPDIEEREGFIQAQLALIQEDIEATEAELNDLEIQYGDLQGAREISEVERQIVALEDKLSSLQTTYASLIASSQQGAVNTLTVVEPAVIPTQSTNPSPVLSIALAMILGAFIATAGAYLLELLDRRANTPQDVYRMLKWQPLAEIETMADTENVATYVATYPQSSVANSFRAAKTGLELAGVGREIRSLLVTGPSASDGKSTISQNLAISFAMGKHRVLLIKGDFYGENEPIENGRGLSDLLVEGGDPEQTLISTPQDNLYILHAGTQTEQAIDLLNKTRLRQILNSLKKSFDVIIMDGPPTFVSDTKVLSASSDGVLVVIRMARSPLDAIDRMKEQFESLDIEPLGIILNDTSRTPVYYQSYYSQRPMPAWQVGLSRFWSGLKGRLGKAQIGRLGKQVYSDDGQDFKT